MAKGDHLGEFELCVLIAVLRCAPEAYGATVRSELAATARRSVSLGAVYAAFARLETKGYVRAELSDPVPVRGGRSRRLYSVTRAGERAISTSTGAISRLLSGLNLGEGSA